MVHTFVYRLGHDGRPDLGHRHPQAFWIRLLFALPSVLSIGMIYDDSRAGADDRCSIGHIEFSHSILSPMTSRPNRASRHLFGAASSARLTTANWTGFLAFLAFWIYNGYLYLTATIGLMYCLFLAKDLRDVIRRMIGMMLGASLIFLPILAYNAVSNGSNILVNMYNFSNSISQGSYSEGLVFPFRYFRDVEQAMCLLWLAGIALAARRVWQRPTCPQPLGGSDKDCRAQLKYQTLWFTALGALTEERRRGLLWLGFLASTLLLMIVLSTPLRQFVLYGRVVRILVPFIAMACAFGIAPLLTKYGRPACVGIVLIAGLIALSNALPALRQQNPLHIAWRVYQEYDDVSFETTVQERFRRWNLQPEVMDARYRLYNSAVYLRISNIDSGRPDGRVILEVPHPLHYKPWQYEGLTKEMRDLVNSNEFKIWLIDTRPDEE